jgi:hypothetical protein
MTVSDGELAAIRADIARLPYTYGNLALVIQHVDHLIIALEQTRADLAATKTERDAALDIGIQVARRWSRYLPLDNLGEELFATTDGGREVHRSWRDHMLAQSRDVAEQRMTWETLDPLDQALDNAIALDVIRCWLRWTGIPTPTSPEPASPDPIAP